MPQRIPRFLACFGLAAMTFLAACGETRVPKLEGDALNPETHRAFIVTIDAIVFNDGPLDAENRDRLSKTFLAVSGIALTDPANTIAMAFGRELKQMSGLAERTRVGTPMLNSPLRKNWLRIRNGLFADAYWYRYSSRDPIEPVVAKPPSPPPGR
jgi:hypothetical protein